MVRLYRIDHNGTPRYAAEREGRWRLVDGDIFGKFTEGKEIQAEGVQFLAPVSPSKVVCVGLNYKDHAAEQNKPLPEEPLLFIKPSTAIIGPDAAIRSADVGRPHRPRSRARHRHRQAGIARADEPGQRLHSRPHRRSTTSPRAICRTRRASTRAARGSTRLRRSGRASPSGSTAATSRCAPTSTARCARIPARAS